MNNTHNNYLYSIVITVTVKTHSEEWQQQLDAFTVQPKEDKKKRTVWADGSVGAHGRKEVDRPL